MRSCEDCGRAEYGLNKLYIPVKSEIEFFPPNILSVSELTYVIIGAREDDKWIFVRNKDRQSWELPAGHIEQGESADEAALRELYEETGTLDATMEAIHDYAVTMDGFTRYGRIFYAGIKDRGNLPDSEIAEIQLAEKSPEPATYPYAHWKFIDVLETYVLSLK